jgi:molybdopterin biosynthesis enzyme
MARANALLVIPAERSVVKPGEEVQAILFADRALTTDTFDV